MRKPYVTPETKSTLRVASPAASDARVDGAESQTEVARPEAGGDAAQTLRTEAGREPVFRCGGFEALAGCVVEWLMDVPLYDAHNHLHDERLAMLRPALKEMFREENLARAVVNGSCEEDWPEVLDLAKQHAEVIPSFGYHPWYIAERTADWQKVLTGLLDAVPSAVGECGLDRWIKGHDLEQQEEVFVRQLRMAAERNLPVSIHCLQAWGRLLEVMRREPRPAVGFLLHSYGGPKEMVEPLAELGAYFSLPGYFAHERKERQREAFREVPLARLLIETDAPDQNLPPERIRHPLEDPRNGKAVNHPGNLRAVYDFAAELRQLPVEVLAKQVEQNFRRLFARWFGP